MERYEIVYNIKTSKGDKIKNIVEYYFDNWFGTSNYLETLKNNGCYNIKVTKIDSIDKRKRRMKVK